MDMTITTHSASETRQWGEQLGRQLQPGTVIALRGDLGAGKTTLTQGIAAGLGIAQRVSSPTFVFMNEYRTPQGWRLVHIDGYRLPELAADTKLDHMLEADTLGLEDIFAADTIVVVEWAERITPYLPPDHLAVRLSPVADHPEWRHIELIAARQSNPKS